MTIEQIIRAVQAKLGGIEIDGIAGPETWRAIYAALIGSEPGARPTGDIPAADARSEKAIATLLPEVRPYARALLQNAAAQGIKLIVTSGTRTYAEQDALYRQKNDRRDNDGDGRIDETDENVTGARGGHSNHNFGLAFDVTIFRGTQPVWESPTYKAVGAIGRSLGLEWGGDWKSRIDEPHFQLRPPWARNMTEPAMLAELRRRKSAGISAFA